ncbi:hypothetical protein ABIC02_007480 [Bradyrhizobium sp. RT5a]
MSELHAPEVNSVARRMTVSRHGTVAGQAPMTDLVARDGTNVRSRLLARLIETAPNALAMEQWTRALRLSEPFCDKSSELPDRSYVGLLEAARGSLGHWMAMRDGKIERYQIIAPTTCNFSPGEFLQRRRSAGAGAGRHCCRRRRPACGCDPAHRALVRSLHGVHRALTGNFVAGCKSNCFCFSCWQRRPVPFMKEVQICNVMESLHF